jgi:predicted unusual protein kinase regulating ubiquinone biosynthesis (AarF/ABC1/UbiB family)
LTSVENGLKSAIYEDVKLVLEEQIPAEARNRYRLAFADRILAEASVGAVVEARYVIPGSSTEARTVCKVLKSGAVSALKEDLTIIDSVLAYLEKNAEFYDIGNTPLVDIFVEIREALSREVRVEDERANLLRARDYYSDVDAVEVPRSSTSLLRA